MSLRFAILGLLSQQELSGYELTKHFGQSVGYFWHARSQQIYPELARLEQEGLVRSRLVAQTGRPDKRLYRVTEQGRAELQAWIVSPSPLTLVKDEFLVKVWGYGLVERAAAIQSLDEHCRMHEERLATYHAILRGSPPLGTQVGAYLTLLAGIRVEQALVGWCAEARQLLAAEPVTQPSGPGASSGAGAPA
ncbi:MAG: PadR family transcriptional regulator [Hyphomicrobiales bacterium]